jgi:hypothetical protein
VIAGTLRIVTRSYAAMRLLTGAMLLAFLVSACGSAGSSAVRPPTPGERARAIRAVNGTWEYESVPLYQGRRHRQFRRLRPKVVRIRVLGADPRFFSAVVELRDERGRRRGPAAVVVFEQLAVKAGPAITFRNACTTASPSSVRALLCPDPWSLLDYPRPRIRAQTRYTQPIAYADLHWIDWREVALPGGVCGSSRPIHPHDERGEPVAFIHPDVELSWWNPVWVYSWTRPVFGDLDGDGRDEAALQVICANGGGTAGGQLAFSAVIFKAVGKSLRVVGIVRPQQPLDPATPHVPLSYVAAIRRNQVVVAEAWYGHRDGTCCASGRARTFWRYDRGQLRLKRTAILRRPWSSPLFVVDVIAEPGGRGLDRDRQTRIVVAPNLRFAVVIENEGGTIKRHVKVRLTIKQSPAPIVETGMIDRIKPWQVNPATVVFRNLGRLQLGRTTAVTVSIEDRGAYPLRYPVTFTRR